MIIPKKARFNNARATHDSMLDAVLGQDCIQPSMGQGLRGLHVAVGIFEDPVHAGTLQASAINDLLPGLLHCDSRLHMPLVRLGDDDVRFLDRLRRGSSLSFRLPLCSKPSL